MALNKAKEKKKALEAELQTNNTQIDEHQTIKDEYDKQMTTLVQETDKIDEEIRRLSKLETDIQNKHKLLETLKTQQSQTERGIEQTKKTLADKQLNVKELKQNISKMKKSIPPSEYPLSEIKQDKDRIINIDKKLDSSTSQWKKDSEDLENLNKKAGEYLQYSPEELQEELQKNKDQQKGLEEERKTKVDEWNSAKENIGVIKNKVAELKEVIASIQQLGNKCPTCFQEITAETKDDLLQQNEVLMNDRAQKGKQQEIRATKLEKEIKKIEMDHNILNEQYTNIKAIQSTIERIHYLRDEITHLHDTIEELSQSLNITDKYPDIGDQSPVTYLSQLVEDMTTYTDQLDHLKTLNQNLRECEKDIQTALENQNRYQQELETIQTTITTTHGEILEKEIEIEPFENFKNQFDTLKHEQEKIKQSIQTESDNILQFKLQKNSNEKDLQQCNDIIADNSAQMSNIDKAVDYYNWLTQFFIPTLPKIEQTLMFQINRDFNTNFKKWFEILVTDETKSVSVDEEFTPIITQDGVDQNVDFLSGGERTSVALAYRLALNAIIQENVVGVRSNLLIFDEPTDGFSKEQLFKFRDILSELNCPQIVLVSHEKELEGFVDQIFMVQKQNGISNIKPVKR
jgi:exonuclease SbcC